MTDFVFLRPYCLFLLVPFSLLLTAIFLDKAKSNAWRDICDTHLYQFLIKSNQRTRQVLPKVIVVLSGILMIIALSGPSWQQKTSTAYVKSDSLVIAVDLSNAMTAKDTQPSRIDRVKFKLHDLLDQLKETEVGLIAYSAEPFLISPLTTDTSTLTLFIPELDPAIMPTQGSNISSAMLMAQELLKNAGKNSGHLLLIGTGSTSKQDIVLAKKLNKQGLTISMLGVGSTFGAPILNKDHQEVISKLHPGELKQLTRAGGGEYQSLTTDDTDINNLLTNIHSSDAHYKKSQNSLKIRKDNGHLLLWFLIPLFLVCFRRGFSQGLLS